MNGWCRQNIYQVSPFYLYMLQWQKGLQDNCVHSAIWLDSHQVCSTNTIYIPKLTTGCEGCQLSRAIPLHRNITRRNKGVFHIFPHCLFERIPKHDSPPVNVNWGCYNKEVDRTVGKHWKEIVIKMMRTSLTCV